MTHATNRARRLAPLPVATLAALLLAGCSTGHIGESWQCPLAAGGSCDSVAAADPAVPDPGASDATALAEPLWRVRGGGASMASAAPPCAADCDGGFDPFGWLARLFGGGDEGEAGSVAGEPGPATADIAAEAPPAASNRDKRIPQPAAAALPAQPGLSRDEPSHDEPAAGGVRTGEVVARIWIAPFVGADGVYREASWVRVVLQPAGWRLRR